jgi:hypothetical protein
MVVVAFKLHVKITRIEAGIKVGYLDRVGADLDARDLF